MSTPEHLDLVQRMDRLERQNRRLKRLILMLAFLAIIPLAMAAVPVPNRKTVTANAFKVVDDQGVVRAEMSADNKGAKVVLFDTKGTTKQAEMSTGDKGVSRFKLFDAKGNERVVMMGDLESTGPILTLMGEDKAKWFLVSAYDPVIRGSIGSSQRTKVKPGEPEIWLMTRDNELIVKFYKGFRGR